MSELRDHAVPARKPYPEDLVESLSELSRVLIGDEDVDSTLTKVCRLAVRTISGADFASVSLVGPREKVSTVGATDARATYVDGLQAATRQGPCLSSIATQETFRIDDISVDTKWPRFAMRTAAETEVQSLLSFVLEVGDRSIASLNLFSCSLRAFDEADERVGFVFAAHAAVVLANAQAFETSISKVSQLESAMLTRGTIGRAIGILQEREGLSEEEAFTHLKELSQAGNKRISAIAEELAEGRGAGG